MQLVPDVPLVHQHGDGFRLPRPARARCHDLEFRVGGGDEIQMPRVAMVEDHPSSPRQSRPQSGRPDEDENRDPGLDAQAIIGSIAIVARGRRQRRRDRIAEETDALVDAAAQLFEPRPAHARIDVDPMAEDDVPVRPLGGEGIIVKALHLLQRAEFGKSEIEHGAHAARAEIIRHLRLGRVVGRRIPGRPLLGKLLLGLQWVAAPSAPMRMDVDDRHASVAPRYEAMTPGWLDRLRLSPSSAMRPFSST